MLTWSLTGPAIRPLAYCLVSWLPLWSSECAFRLLFRSFYRFHFLKCLSLNSRKHSDIIYLSMYLSHFPCGSLWRRWWRESANSRFLMMRSSPCWTSTWSRAMERARPWSTCAASSPRSTSPWPAAEDMPEAALGVPVLAASVTVGHVVLVTRSEVCRDSVSVLVPVKGHFSIWKPKFIKLTYFSSLKLSMLLVTRKLETIGCKLLPSRSYSYFPVFCEMSKCHRGHPCIPQPGFSDVQGLQQGTWIADCHKSRY